MNELTIAFPYVFYEKDGKLIYYDDNGKTPTQVAAQQSIVSIDRLIDQIKTHKPTMAACALLRSEATSDADKKHIKMTSLFRIYLGKFELLPNKYGNLKYEDAGLKEHPGMACFDLDNLSPALMQTTINTLKSDQYTFVGFISPRGTGYKWFVKIPPSIENHHNYYRGLLRYYSELIDVPLDESCINPSRCCFMSHDPDPFVNKDSYIWTTMEIEPEREPIIYNESDTSDEILNNVNAAVRRVESRGTDVAPTYKEWLSLCASLSTIGENGRAPLHRLLRLSTKYNAADTDELFDKMLNDKKERKNPATLATFFYMTKK